MRCRAAAVRKTWDCNNPTLLPGCAAVDGPEDDELERAVRDQQLSSNPGGGRAEEVVALCGIARPALIEECAGFRDHLPMTTAVTCAEESRASVGPTAGRAHHLW